MQNKIDFIKADEFTQWILCEIVDKDSELFKDKNFNASEMEVEIKINGVDEDFQKFVNRFEESISKMVQNKAKKLVLDEFKGKFSSVINNISELAEDFEDRIKHNIEEHFKYEWEKSIKWITLKLLVNVV